MFSMKSGCVSAIAVGTVFVAACGGDFAKSGNALTGPSPATPAALTATVGANLRVTPAGGAATGADLQMSGSASTGRSTARPRWATLPNGAVIPTAGSTAPDGSVTFTWCNANADNFLTVESIPGAHDIFFAFTGGAGVGAGVNSITLGPACNIPSATSPTTGCIPARGETIYVTLFTLKNKVNIAPSPFQYTFIAANQSSQRLKL